MESLSSDVKNKIYTESHLFFQTIGFEKKSDMEHQSFTELFMQADKNMSISLIGEKIQLSQILRGFFRQNPIYCVEYLNILTQRNPTFKYIFQNGIYGIEIVSPSRGRPINKVSHIQQSANDQVFAIAA